MILRIALRAAAFVPLFVILGGLIGGAIAGTGVLAYGTVTGEIPSPSDPPELRFPQVYVLFLIYGVLVGSPAAAVTGLLAAVANREFPRPRTYIAVVTGAGAAMAGLEAACFVLFPENSTAIPALSTVAAIAAIGAVAAFVCAWLTRPRPPHR